MITIPANTKIGYGNTNVLSLGEPLTFDPTGLSILVGANGQGKTTLLKYLAGVIGKTGCRGLFAADDLMIADPITPRDLRRCLVDPTHKGFFDRWVSLLEIPNKAWGELSKGMRQKIRIALAVTAANQTARQLICLDEPFSGLDFAARRVVWKLLAEEVVKRHVILSIHAEPIRIAPTQLIAVRDGTARRHDPLDNWDVIEKLLTQ